MSDQWVITLRAEGPGPEPILRLRRLLKVALRAFGLRCVDVAEAPPEPSAPSPTTPAPEASAHD